MGEEMKTCQHAHSSFVHYGGSESGWGGGGGGGREKKKDRFQSFLSMSSFPSSFVSGSLSSLVFSSLLVAAISPVSASCCTAGTAGGGAGGSHPADWSGLLAGAGSVHQQVTNESAVF